MKIAGSAQKKTGSVGLVETRVFIFLGLNSSFIWYNQRQPGLTAVPPAEINYSLGLLQQQQVVPTLS